MSRIDFAARRFREIVPRPLLRHESMPRADLEAWLRNDVAVAADDLVRLPRFREVARATVQAFSPGAPSREWQSVLDVHAALVRYARIAWTVGRLRSIARNFPEEPASIAPLSHDVTIDSAPRTVVIPTLPISALVSVTSYLLQAAEFGREQAESFVCVRDYFEPQPEFAGEGAARIQRADLLLSIHADLPAVGNLIAWSLLRRIRLRMQILDDFTRVIRRAERACSRRLPDRLEELADAALQAHAAEEAVRNVVMMGPENRICEAASVLTQTYAAFHPDPDLSWLQLPPEVLEDGGAVVAARLRQFRGSEFVERIAAALGTVAHLYDGAPRGLSAMEQAIADGGLVIDRNAGVAYWRGERLRVDARSRVGFRLFVQLASYARTGRTVGESDAYDDDVVSDSALSTAIGRLMNVLPDELATLIERGVLPRTYRMHAVPGGVQIFPS